MMPKRLKRSRRLGWRKPTGAVIVDRTSRWGNPFKVRGDMIYGDASHRRVHMDPWVFISGPHPEVSIHALVVTFYQDWIHRLDWTKDIVRPCMFTVEDIKKQLAGKDIICYCEIDAPCHGDVLLELANQQGCTDAPDLEIGP